MRKHIYFTCKCKKSHSTQNDAEDALQRLQINVIDKCKSNSLTIYQCPYCNYYHIGKHPTIFKREKELYRIKQGMEIIKNKLTKNDKNVLGKFIGLLISQKKRGMK